MERRIAAIAAGVGVLYLAWVGVLRRQGEEQMALVRQEREARKYLPYLDEDNDGKVKITQFYAGSGELTRGERAVVCYGVRNAVAVRLDPPVEPVKPAMNRCFAVSPTEQTTYRLTAEGADGGITNAEFTLHVNPPPPEILFLSASSKQIKRGEPFTLCYGVRNTVNVSLAPVPWHVVPAEKYCVRGYPVRTTDFVLTASGEDGRTDRLKFRLVVQ